ncbi:MAG: translation initiation factor IF-2 [Candidatus Diapherotrites archaeon]|nr:translation initiation factor IF-2 [Candidatus Diapherotrites archaeon]
MLRQPIVTVLGHVDHGKTTILDRIRRTSVHSKEAGGITQHIGASEVPIDAIKEIAKPILQSLPIKFKIPGLLFIDTPGHEAFTNLRKRGGSIADLAVLVVDITQGFQPQTYEALEILKNFKVPFVVAANKIDLLPGWRSKEDYPITLSMKEQDEEVLNLLDAKIYEIVAELGKHGFASERFDRVTDFTREVLIIPVSGKTGEGIPELLLYLAGLAQKYLENRLDVDINKPGKGVILEIKEDVGLGKTATVILYEGRMRRGDEILYITQDGVKKSRIRALLRPKPLDEIRSPRDKFRSVEEVVAAAGVKVAAPGIEEAIPGSPIVVSTPEREEELKKELEREMGELEFETDDVGVIVKADTLGTLEALVGLLRKRGVPIRKAQIGNISRKDVVEAYTVKQQDRYRGVILGFNVDVDKNAEAEAKAKGVPIIVDNVIYRLLEKYEQFLEEEREREMREVLEKLVLPGKIQILPGYVFRRSDPAIVGVRVLGGVIRPKYPLMREDGKVIGTIRGIQSEGRPLEEAKEGMEVAVAIDGPMVGRHIDEGDVLYTDVPKEHAREFLKRSYLFPSSYVEVLKEIFEIQKKRRE